MQILAEYIYSDPLPIELLDNRGLQLLKSQKFIEIKIENSSTFTLRSLGYSGHLDVGEWSFLFTPKHGMKFLETCLPLALHQVNRGESSSLGTSRTPKSIDQLIAHFLLQIFETSLRSNIRKDYIRKEHAAVHGSGQLQVSKSLMFLNHSLGAPTWVQSEISREHPLNRVSSGIYNLAAQVLKINLKTKSMLMRAGAAISNTYLEPTKTNISNSIQQIDRRTEHYRPLLEAALLIFQTFQIGGGNLSCKALLFENWRIFELAIRHSLRAVLGIGSELQNWMAYCTATGQGLDPDLVFLTPSGTFLADVKYVENNDLKLNRDHMFQLNAYMDGFKVTSAYLLYPTSAQVEKQVYKLVWGHQISVVAISISDPSSFQIGIEFLLRNVSNANGTQVLV